MSKALVLGAGGFIGSHLVKLLKAEGYYVKGIDLKYPAFSPTEADEFIIADLRDFSICEKHLTSDIDELYQLAADMGGAGYLFSGENDFNVMHNSASINLNVAHFAIKNEIGRVFFSSSACIYPQLNQTDPSNPNCEESSAYPADPDSEYGWEKIFSERLFDAARRNYKLNVRIARFHNVYGPEGAWDSGKEKAPAAMCRKVIEASENEGIEIWGTGEQTRSFLYIDDCLSGIRALMKSECSEPLNIGSEEMVSINELARKVIELSGKKLHLKHIDGPIGVMGRNSDNRRVKSTIGWEPVVSLDEGISKTFEWIQQQVNQTVK